MVLSRIVEGSILLTSRDGTGGGWRGERVNRGGGGEKRWMSIGKKKFELFDMSSFTNNSCFTVFWDAEEKDGKQKFFMRNFLQQSEEMVGVTPGQWRGQTCRNSGCSASWCPVARDPMARLGCWTQGDSNPRRKSDDKVKILDTRRQ
ncbi:hypothetical protein RRG08_049281 [Elysia crispata]|uniref:Uncharacterized protein n=1 Tax=Elysia crispata TaxID=231223 RepID=A0AAE0ZPR3_9GAST|nr:hypothetical protein RRG08_049281 [Elysia crispata]